MELICQNYRLYAEPIRILLQTSNISFRETLSHGNLKDLRILTKDNTTMQDYQKIIQYLSDIFLKTSQPQQEQKNDEKHSHEVITFNNAHLANLVSLYVQIADAIEAEQLLSSPIEQLLKGYIDLIGERKFLAGEFLTPIDVIFYEIIRTLDAINKRPKNHLIYKYTERFEAVSSVREYVIDPKTYLRAFTSKVDTPHVRKSKVLEGQVPALSHFVMSEGMMLVRQKQLAESQELVEVPCHFPFSLTPKRVSKQEVMDLIKNEEKWNVLINEMARDFDWYSEHLKDMIKTEDFVRRLYEIAKKCRAYPHTQKIFFALIRNDYMYQSIENRWLQVEFNVIAIGPTPYCGKLQKIHRNIGKNNFEEEDVEYYEPENTNMIEEGLVQAFKCYGNPKAIVIMVVPPTHELNVLQQRAIEKKLFDNGIKCCRASLSDVYKNHKFDESTGTLYMNGEEVGLVYFRGGYQPDHYLDDNDWKAREIIELSRAVKCPNVDLQLINFKIFQLYLAKDKVLAKFFPEKEEREALQKNFAKFWEIDSPEKVPNLLKMVKANPKLYVLKPQKEGGGNNFFEDEIIRLFETLSFEELSTHLLMERIDPTPHISLFVRNKELSIVPAVPELGIYSYILSDPEKLIKNVMGGYTVRTKVAASSEGGIGAGRGVLDSFVFE